MSGSLDISYISELTCKDDDKRSGSTVRWPDIVPNAIYEGIEYPIFPYICIFNISSCFIFCCMFSHYFSAYWTRIPTRYCYGSKETIRKVLKFRYLLPTKKRTRYTYVLKDCILRDLSILIWGIILKNGKDENQRYTCMTIIKMLTRVHAADILPPRCP